MSLDLRLVHSMNVRCWQTWHPPPTPPHPTPSLCLRRLPLNSFPHRQKSAGLLFLGHSFLTLYEKLPNTKKLNYLQRTPKYPQLEATIDVFLCFFLFALLSICPSLSQAVNPSSFDIFQSKLQTFLPFSRVISKQAFLSSLNHLLSFSAAKRAAKTRAMLR